MIKMTKNLRAKQELVSKGGDIHTEITAFYDLKHNRHHHVYIQNNFHK